jgi:hypothetical protein
MVAAMKTKQSSEIGPVVAPAGLVKEQTPSHMATIGFDPSPFDKSFSGNPRI